MIVYPRSYCFQDSDNEEEHESEAVEEESDGHESSLKVGDLNDLSDDEDQDDEFGADSDDDEASGGNLK